MDVVRNVELTIKKVENLPMPLIYLANAEDLARWQIDQLRWAYEHGERKLNLSCFDTAGMGFGVDDAAPVVLRAVMGFMRECGDIESLSIFCGDELSCRAYSQALAELTAAKH